MFYIVFATKQDKSVPLADGGQPAEGPAAAGHSARRHKSVYRLILEPREAISASVQQTSFIEAQWFREKTVCYGGNQPFREKFPVFTGIIVRNLTKLSGFWRKAAVLIRKRG